MARNNFDDSDDEWNQPSPSSDWDSSESSDASENAKSLNLKFKVNPKRLGASVAGLIILLVLIAVVPGQFSSSKETSTPKPTASSTPTTPVVEVDLYTQPKKLQTFIDNALASSVTIYCSNYSGSGWAIDLSDDSSTSKDDAYPTEIITNHHVIEGCESSGVTIVPMGTDSQYSALVYSYDVENDLAVLITSKDLAPFATIQPGNEARVGQWVMAVGSPGAGDTTLDGSITTGTITNLRDGVVITDTTINPGNSGGPLLNSAGEVIAVVSAKVVAEKVDSIGIARDVSLICVQLDGCTKKRLLK